MRCRVNNSGATVCHSKYGARDGFGVEHSANNVLSELPYVATLTLSEEGWAAQEALGALSLTEPPHEMSEADSSWSVGLGADKCTTRDQTVGSKGDP
jgi:hypothetical protein